MDVLIVPEARREIEALQALRPAAGTWGVLVGHRRGPRYFVEKVVTAGPPERLPDERVLEEFDRIWPGGIIGLAVIKPGAAFKRAVLAPAWYGKIVLQSTGPERWGRVYLSQHRGSRKIEASPFFRAALVSFERRFFLDPVPFAEAAKEEARE